MGVAVPSVELATGSLGTVVEPSHTVLLLSSGGRPWTGVVTVVASVLWGAYPATSARVSTSGDTRGSKVGGTLVPSVTFNVIGPLVSVVVGRVVKVAVGWLVALPALLMPFFVRVWVDVRTVGERTVANGSVIIVPIIIPIILVGSTRVPLTASLLPMEPVGLGLGVTVVVARTGAATWCMRVAGTFRITTRPVNSGFLFGPFVSPNTPTHVFLPVTVSVVGEKVPVGDVTAGWAGGGTPPPYFTTDPKGHRTLPDPATRPVTTGVGIMFRPR